MAKLILTFRFFTGIKINTPCDLCVMSFKSQFNIFNKFLIINATSYVQFDCTYDLPIYNSSVIIYDHMYCLAM